MKKEYYCIYAEHQNITTNLIKGRINIIHYLNTEKKAKNTIYKLENT